MNAVNWQERAEKAEEKLTTARDDMQSWIDSRNGWMEECSSQAQNGVGNEQH